MLMEVYLNVHSHCLSLNSSNVKWKEAVGRVIVTVRAWGREIEGRLRSPLGTGHAHIPVVCELPSGGR